MLTAEQRTCLETLVQDMDADLHVDSASLEADHTLEIVLCSDFVCFRPLRIAPHEVDVAAALNGDPQAQQRLQNHLRGLLPGTL